MTACYVFDIDGTLADCSHRLHHIQKQPKDWPAFFAGCADDAPITHIVDLAIMLTDADRVLVFVSGRSDECREATQKWLDDNQLVGPLYMRRAEAAGVPIVRLKGDRPDRYPSPRTETAV